MIFILPLLETRAVIFIIMIQLIAIVLSSDTVIFALLIMCSALNGGLVHTAHIVYMRALHMMLPITIVKSALFKIRALNSGAYQKPMV